MVNPLAHSLRQEFSASLLAELAALDPFAAVQATWDSVMRSCASAMWSLPWVIQSEKWNFEWYWCLPLFL
jgi:hypothetical protein